MGTVLTHCGVVPYAGVLGFRCSFDCNTATFILFISSTTPGSVRLFPVPLALRCKTLNVLASLIYSVDGAGVGGGEGGGNFWDGVAGSIDFSPILCCI